jgi:peptidoglycan/xylan/chitin deacetylase (PgdA/CDA1 family)
VSAHSAGCMKSEMLQSFFTPGFASNNREDLRGVLLTFDDGWSAAIDEAGPLLEHHGWQATVFVTIDLLDRPHFLGRAALARLNPRVFRIGSHAMTHRMLSLLCEKEIKAELGDSKKQLEDLAGYEIDMLSIPNGAVDQRVRDVAAECGYRFVFDSHVAVERRGFNPLSIGRVAIKQNTPIEAFTRFLATGLARERMLRGLLGVPKNVLGLRRYEMLRKWVFERSAADGNDGGELNALS